MRRRALSVLTPLALFSTLAACAADEPVVESDGSCAAANGADICSWSSAQGGRTLEAGITVPLATIQNAPSEQPMSWPPAEMASVAMPASDAPAKLAYVTTYWEPTGHPPAPYLVPHFDFHFYLIPDERRRAIDCADTTKPATLPEGYVLPDEKLPPEVAEMIGVETLVGICVPTMGMHALDAVEVAGTTPFESTMVIGYYGGEPIFVEPMIAQTTLLRRETFEIPVPAVPGLEGKQPTAFQAVYDPAEDAYRFTFTGFGATE